MKGKKSIPQVGYVLFLLIAIIILFQWYTTRNQERIEERNKNYAADSAQLKAVQIDDELSNALSRINTYAFFLEKSLSEPTVNAQTLKEIEENSMFDVVLFTDRDGIDHSADGRTADVSERLFYLDGIQGGAISRLFLTLIWLMKLCHAFIHRYTIMKRLLVCCGEHSLRKSIYRVCLLPRILGRTRMFFSVQWMGG